MISKRVQRIEESAIRKVFEMTASSDKDLLNFSIGQPHFETPKNLKNKIGEAALKNFNNYTSTKGLQGLRDKISEKLNKKNSIKAEPDEIIVTTGVSGALFLTFGTLLDEGDEVIVPDPYFVLYKQLLNFLGVKPVYLDTYPDFHLKAKKIESLVGGDTKAILLNTPNNPTGAVYDKNELSEVAKIAEEYNLYIISDEVYEQFDYDNKFFSVGSIYNKTITLNGFSKSHLVTGWRVGYAHGPREVIDAMNKLQQYTFVCAPSTSQYALENEWNVDLSECTRLYKKNRDYLVKNLSQKYVFSNPAGAYYAYIKIPAHKEDFISELIKNKILVVPGEAFSLKEGYFRLSFAVEHETLKKGIETLNKLVK